MAKKVAAWPGAFKAYEIAWRQIMKNPEPMWFFVAIYTVVTATSMLIQGVSSTTDKGYVPYADAITIIFIVPLINYALSLIAGKKLTVSEFMQFSLKKLLLLVVLSVLLGLIIFGSLLLLIIPAIWTIAWFAQSSYALVDKDLGPIESLKESKRISQNHKSKVWGLIGISLLISIAGAMFSVIPYLGNAAIAFVSVLTTVAAAHLYKWLEAASSN